MDSTMNCNTIKTITTDNTSINTTTTAATTDTTTAASFNTDHSTGSCTNHIPQGQTLGLNATADQCVNW